MSCHKSHTQFFNLDDFLWLFFYKKFFILQVFAPTQFFGANRSGLFLQLSRELWRNEAYILVEMKHIWIWNYTHKVCQRSSRCLRCVEVSKQGKQWTEKRKIKQKKIEHVNHSKPAFIAYNITTMIILLFIFWFHLNRHQFDDFIRECIKKNI